MAAPKFGPQHYNAIAKDIREELTTALDFYKFGYSDYVGKKNTTHGRNYYGVEALVKLALRFARRFEADNERFDPLKFLDQCSPNDELYPLSELWESSSPGEGIRRGGYGGDAID
jgi:hypothetical protein